MQGTHFTVSYHTAGNVAANHSFIFKVPFPCQLISVSAAASNASAASSMWATRRTRSLRHKT